jgi:hypothetical protein
MFDHILPAETDLSLALSAEYWNIQLRQPASGSYLLYP